MTTTHKFWTDPAFEEFLPYIKVQRAHDTTSGRNRLEFVGAPLPVLVRAMRFTGPCARCGQEIDVFRPRKAPSQRGKTGAVYLAACCPLNVNVGCSRGGAATAAYAAITNLARGVNREPFL